MNIYDIPLFYISFNRNMKVENHLIENGFTNVNHFEAVNGKKFNLKELLQEKLITISTYNDILYGREQHSSLPSLGAVGCTMSHFSLWRKCIEDDMDFIIIAEEDVHINRKFTKNDIDFINRSLAEQNGIFTAAEDKKGKGGVSDFRGTHFYIITKDACKILANDAFPISVQTDHYISHKKNIGQVSIRTRRLAGQGRHISSIQDICFKCNVPANKYFYIIIIFIFSISILYNIKTIYEKTISPTRRVD